MLRVVFREVLVQLHNGAIVARDGKMLRVRLVGDARGWVNKQFVTYGAARASCSPREIARIPEMLGRFDIIPEVQPKMSCPIKAARLEGLLQGP
jgi:hypothetical protein